MRGIVGAVFFQRRQQVNEAETQRNAVALSISASAETFEETKRRLSAIRQDAASLISSKVS